MNGIKKTIFVILLFLHFFCVSMQGGSNHQAQKAPLQGNEAQKYVQDLKESQLNLLFLQIKLHGINNILDRIEVQSNCVQTKLTESLTRISTLLGPTE